MSNKRNNKKYNKLGLLIIEAVLICVIVAGYFIFMKNFVHDDDKNPDKTGQNTSGDATPSGTNSGVTETPTPTEQTEEEKREEEAEKLLGQADLYAMQYDYDKAISLVKGFDNYTQVKVLTDALAGYEEKKSTLKRFGAYDSAEQINHIFFHILVADTSKAFDGDYKQKGYNYYMTTVSEFNAMLEQLYDQGYVLVKIHDVAHKVKDADGKESFEAGDIMLPPDKKPLVISQDDVNYYEYMTGDGFARRIVLDKDNNPTTEMVMDDGSVSIGDYDMVPLLEKFVKEHPDFSYKGAKAILALTGYDGSLGYRTNDPKSATYKEDQETVKKIVKVMKEKGWEFASHSYGHRDMGKATYSFTVKDTDRWEKEVGSLIGPTDIYIFPFGLDIETTMGHYSSDKFKYLKKLGFDYFCGVFKEPWMQIKDDYVRMTRRPMDGQAMLEFPERLEDLFDLSKVIDKDRPKWEK
ncbi:polysaccharide deacetylase family protein [Anaerocolumna xylanovorans]|uniref:Peptidoglycan/xylan/chitin deacetylase, PgdA/CDA1 family n=1 Tax=Anaerocolumna xylanovorans DSM 12503 TaxID=1121345 RepID=A0A1M7Y8D2_9FIRM|nr:polysaccharide deacetylase family protein [Anaerocolumna xylanovorans]SHO48831.1 Peptidoglycan/xylan/chitin deacetylase, PgdA/CDA1 family [Anaerocolumna xylanovorans DSM 12503]